MLSGIHGQDASFLTGVNRIQDRISQVSQQITSGVRVSKPSDDPSVIAPILHYQEQLDQLTQVQSNLTLASSDASAADNALQSAASILDNISSLGSQGMTLSANSDTRTILANQIQALQAQLVSIANTNVRGFYIFGGDNTTTPPYTLSSSAMNGITQNSSGISTREVNDANGASRDATLSASQIFDAPSSTPGTVLTDANLGSNPALDSTAYPGIAQSFTFRIQGQSAPLEVSVPGTPGGYSTEASLVSAVQTAIDASLAAGTPPLAAGTVTVSTNASNILQFQTTSSSFTVTDNGADDTAHDSPAGIGPGNPASNNIFASVAALSAALYNNDTGAIRAAITNLKDGSAHLQTSSAFYGNVSNWIQNAQSSAAAQTANLTNALHLLQDTDITGAITTLTTSNTALQAAISAHASLPMKTLFDYLG